MVASEPRIAEVAAAVVRAPAHAIRQQHAAPPRLVDIYDTTLRDGTQMEGISVSVDDKLKIARVLSNFGMHYIEGGWPGSNPKDAEFFERAKAEPPPDVWSRIAELPPEAWSRIAAFGSTRRKNSTCEQDKQLATLIAAGTNCVTIVAKAWDLHVDHILEVPREENLAMVGESVAFLKAAGKEVMIDLEHFFDGFKANPAYTMQVCERAVEAGADVLVLCDTNGGTLGWEVDQAVRTVASAFPGVRLGIHCHNDQELAVSNSLQAVQSGATVVQGTINGIGGTINGIGGTINGIGERTGNANLASIVPTLQLKMGCAGVGERLPELTALCRFVDEQLNRLPDSKAPYVGQSAFAHKGGIHVSAVNKIPDSYQHIDPAAVGNVRRTLVSELSGRSNILSKVEEFGMGSKEEFSSPEWQDRMNRVLTAVKTLEKRGSTFEGADATVNLIEPLRGYTFEGADATVNLMIRRLMPGYTAPFRLMDYTVTAADTMGSDALRGEETGTPGSVMPSVRATVKVKLPAGVSQMESLASFWDNGDRTQRLESAEGNGPVNALAKALNKALLPTFPSLQHVVLKDYKASRRPAQLPELRVFVGEVVQELKFQLKVRILDQESATAANTRVMIEFMDSHHNQQWATVGVDTNIISASMCALMDGFEYALVEYAPCCSLDRPRPPVREEDDPFEGERS
ncbi:2-Isopropylmalate synthase [Tribonema minus]|uniref:(R)-citramalate synthase n=1 Tax=Tribonema minus TaxID=303371 RepID=A0A836CCG4_9STRA|nr:2-Isopropylmalate synthase [Tribonema minus]